MYYEDENNLYHYSYRKGDKVENVRDVDYTEVPNTAATADPWEEKKPKKNRLGLKIAALALACALIGGAAGAGITHHAFASARGSTQIEVSDRQVAEVRQVKVDGKQQLTMPEVYAANVNSVVSINVSTTPSVSINNVSKKIGPVSLNSLPRNPWGRRKKFTMLLIDL